MLELDACFVAEGHTLRGLGNLLPRLTCLSADFACEWWLTAGEPGRPGRCPCPRCLLGVGEWWPVSLAAPGAVLALAGCGWVPGKDAGRSDCEAFLGVP